MTPPAMAPSTRVTWLRAISTPMLVAAVATPPASASMIRRTGVSTVQKMPPSSEPSRRRPTVRCPVVAASRSPASTAAIMARKPRRMRRRSRPSMRPVTGTLKRRRGSIRAKVIAATSSGEPVTSSA